jgi:hypothetical protein
MPKPRTPKRYRCRFCGIVLPAWYDVPGEPNGTMLFQHMSQAHHNELRPFRDRIERTDDITRIILEAYEEVEEN